MGKGDATLDRRTEEIWDAVFNQWWEMETTSAPRKVVAGVPCINLRPHNPFAPSLHPCNAFMSPAQRFVCVLYFSCIKVLPSVDLDAQYIKRWWCHRPLAGRRTTPVVWKRFKSLSGRSVSTLTKESAEFWSMQNNSMLRVGESDYRKH